jgi:hypothetical protein
MGDAAGETPARTMRRNASTAESGLTGPRVARDDRAPGDAALLGHFVEHVLGLTQAERASVKVEQGGASEKVGREAEIGGYRMELRRGGRARRRGAGRSPVRSRLPRDAAGQRRGDAVSKWRRGFAARRAKILDMALGFGNLGNSSQHGWE